MPSITSYTSETPSSVGYFKDDTAGVGSTAFYYPLQSSFNFAVGSPAAGNEYNTGYICTWTANPASIPCEVSRIKNSLVI